MPSDTDLVRRCAKRKYRWASNCRPFGRSKVIFPIIGVNWKGYVYVANMGEK